MVKKTKIKKAKVLKPKVKKTVAKTALPSPLKLDLACGEHKMAGYFGIDIAKRDGVDMIVDLEQYPWPFADNSVTEVFCAHYIEHTKDIIKFMDELYRILKPGCKAIIIAPYYTSIRAWQDPTHTRVISEGTFLYFSKTWRRLNHMSYYPIKCDFEFTYGFEYFPE